jgi:hypothetical protein
VRRCRLGRRAGPERDQDSVVTIPCSGRRKCIFYLARFDAASGGRAAASSVTLRMTEPRRATTGRETPAPARSGRRPRTTIAKAAGGKRSSSSLADQVLALATGRTQQEITAACKEARSNHVGAAIARGDDGIAPLLDFADAPLGHTECNSPASDPSNI